MLCFSICNGDVEGALESGEGGGGLTFIDNGIPPTISVVTYCKTRGDRLDIRRFHERADDMERFV